MVDMSIWVDEFLFTLFDYLNYGEEEDAAKGKIKKRMVTRSLSKVAESEADKEYFEKLQSASENFASKVEENKLDLVDKALNVMKDLNLNTKPVEEVAQNVGIDLIAA